MGPGGSSAGLAAGSNLRGCQGGHTFAVDAISVVLAEIPPSDAIA